VFQRLLFCCAFALTLSGADVSGIWNGQLTDQNGDVQDISFRFVQTGDTLSGKMYGDNESTPIADAKIAGNQITFSVTSELNGQITTFVYSGTTDGAEMQLTRRRTGAMTEEAKAKAKSQEKSIKLNRVA
jgi:hypothetical protein